MKSFRLLFVFTPMCIASLISLSAQENPTPKELISQDKIQCFSIPTEIDALDYQKSVKCITKDAICYIIQGFAMSCIPRSGKYPQELPDMTPKPVYP
jgi:hypothetical protein